MCFYVVTLFCASCCAVTFESLTLAVMPSTFEGSSLGAAKQLTWLKHRFSDHTVIWFDTLGLILYRVVWKTSTNVCFLQVVCLQERNSGEKSLNIKQKNKRTHGTTGISENASG